MANCVLQVENVSKKFLEKTALDGISFSLNENDFLLLAGSNGSGKSVLMSLIAGLDQPTSGSIFRQAVPGLIFQDADCQILGETPFEDVAFGAKNCGLKGEALKERVEAALKSVGLFEKQEMNARTLSGGEKRRLAIAGILAMERDLIIFDEPFANLDWPGVRQVCRVLQELKNSGKTIIVLTHEIEKIIGLSNRFIVLDKGKIRFDGSPADGLLQDLEEWSIKNPLAHLKNGHGNDKGGESPASSPDKSLVEARLKELVWL